MKSIILLLLITLSCVNSNLITNGGFELNSCNDPAYCEYGVGDLVCPGWIVSFGNVDLVNSVAEWVGYDGDFSIDLDGIVAGGIYQDVSTTIGTGYILTFQYSGNYNPACANLKQMSVTATGSSPATFFDDATTNTPSNMNYQLGTYSFTATSSTTRISFNGVNSGCAGVVIDAVDLSVAELHCSDTNPADWNIYGEGYYCSNGNVGFIQCWGSAGTIYESYQNCATGTSCRCFQGEECSSNGQQSPCA